MSKGKPLHIILYCEGCGLEEIHDLPNYGSLEGLPCPSCGDHMTETEVEGNDVLMCTSQG